MAFDDMRVRDNGGTSILRRESYDTGEYVAFDIREATGNEDAILVGLTIRNNTISDQDENTDDAIARIGLAEDPDDADTWDVYPDKDSVYLRFDPLKRRRSVWIKNIAGSVTLNFVAEYDIR